jgi:hypothetical protein
LTGDFGFDEKLIFDLRVFKKIPSDWKVNPSEFQFSMNIVGQVKIAGKVSTDLNDMLGAFVGDKCRGVVNLQYIPQFDNYLAFITIYSNTVDPEPIKFKIWDDSEGQVFTNVTPDYNFQPNQSIGKPALPILFEAINVVENDIVVPQGWKWISFGLTSNQLADVNSIMKDMIAANGDQIKGDKFFDSYSATEKKWLGSISLNGGFKSKTMYKLKAANASKIRFSGQIPDPTQTTIDIVKGWNWIGFISQRNMGVNEALQSFAATDGDIIKSQYQVAIFDQNFGWIGNLQSLVPNEGYMLFSDKATSYTYPEVTSLGRYDDADIDFSYWNLGEFSLNPHTYEKQMTVIAELNSNVEINENVRLLALVNNKIVGIGTPIMNPLRNKTAFFLTVFTNDTDAEVKYTLVQSDGSVIGNANEQSAFGIDQMIGDIKNPLVLTLDIDMVIEEESNGIAIYPNPFVKDINVVFSLDKKAIVDASIYNVTGQRVNQFIDRTLDEGKHSFTWDSAGLPAGMYHIQLIIDGNTHLFKIVKQ